jgi:hypothetical protein
MRDPAGMLFCVIPEPSGALDDSNAQRWDRPGTAHPEAGHATSRPAASGWCTAALALRLSAHLKVFPTATMTLPWQKSGGKPVTVSLMFTKDEGAI